MRQVIANLTLMSVFAITTDFEMELFLLRHGASLANERMLVCGSADYAISEKGLRQAETVCRSLESTPFDRVYTSPLSRAVSTITSLRLNARYLVEEQIKELDTGEVSHITLPELWLRDERFRRPWLFPDLRYPGGETFHEMVDRISSWFETHFRSWPSNERVLVVGHEGTLRVIYLKLMGLSLDEYPDFPIGNCDYLYFKLSGKRVARFEHVVFSEKGGVIT
jgi:broad specificity phosphatase PhoE